MLINVMLINKNMYTICTNQTIIKDEGAKNSMEIEQQSSHASQGLDRR